MNLEQVMHQKNFVIVGDTLNKNKYAYKIKQAMIKNKYNVFSVGKELQSINDVETDIDIIDLCIHPAKGVKLLQENKKPFKSIVIQPGAESEELLTYLNTQNIPYIQDCLLIGLEKKQEN